MREVVVVHSEQFVISGILQNNRVETFEQAIGSIVDVGKLLCMVLPGKRQMIGMHTIGVFVPQRLDKTGNCLISDRDSY